MRAKAPAIRERILVLDSTPPLVLDVKRVVEFDSQHDAWLVEGAVPGGTWHYAFWVRERRVPLSGERQWRAYDISQPLVVHA